MSLTYGSNVPYGSGDFTYGGDGQFLGRPAFPAEFVRRIAMPNVRLQFLVTVQVGKWIPTGVLQDFGLFYSEGWSIANDARIVAIHTNAGSEPLLHDTTDYGGALPPPLPPGRWCRQGDYIYISPPLGRTINDDDYRAILDLRFSKNPSDLRDLYWEPRLKAIPNLSLRIEPRFSGVGQIGGGRLSMVNDDGLFDALDTELYQWDAGTVTMEMGIDLADGTAMSAADYQIIGTWEIDTHERSDTEFTLNLREIKTRLENKVPRLFFNRDEFPAIDNEQVGKPIPFAWGRIYAAKPVVIDAANKQFKVAGHAIRAFQSVRVRSSDESGWTEINFATTDLERGEFTLGEDWDGTAEVVVDFDGRINPDGSLMENGADICRDLLDLVGETEMDEFSFDAAHAFFKVGTNRYGDDVTHLAPSLYLDSQRTALDVASEINSICGTFLFVDFEGVWRFAHFAPTRADDLTAEAGNLPRIFTDRDILAGSFRKTVDTSKVFSKVVVRYAARLGEDWAEAVEIENERMRNLHGLPSIFSEERTVGLSKRSDALYWGQRLLTMEAEPLTKFQFSMPWNGFFLLPGDQFKLTRTRGDISAVLEILEVQYDLLAGNLRIVAGNLRGWNDSFGFWTGDAEADWDSNWTDAEAATAKQNSGYWGTDTDLALATDQRSHRASRWS